MSKQTLDVQISRKELGMSRRYTLFPLFFLAVVLVFTSSLYAGYERINAPNPDDPMAVHIYRLDNGLTVYLTENHETPRFHAEIAVRAGSKNDPIEATGLAHYMEHLLFKGTDEIGTLDYEKEKVHLDRIDDLYEQRFRETDPERRDSIFAEINKETQLAAQYAIPNELDKIYKAMGESGLNAGTNWDYTIYQVSLPANRLRQWAAVETERFQKPIFRLFLPELEIVYEEKNRSMDNKDRLIFRAVAERLYKNHPYGRTRLGSAEHLKNPSIKNVNRFFDTYYVPDNMAICISGDIDIDETIEIIDKRFSAWKREDVPRPTTWQEEPLKGREHATVKYQGEEYVLLAFRTAHQNHRDAEALSLLDMILDNRTAGLINLNLNQQQKVRRAGSYPDMMNDYGAQYLYGIPKKGQSLEEVEQLLLEQIELIKKGEFEEWILPAIVTDFKKDRKSQLESDGRRVGMMRDAFLAYEDWDQAIAEIARMEKVTKADIVRVANTYFGENYVVGYRVDEQHEVPKLDKPQIDKIDIDPARQSAFAGKVLGMPYEEIEPVFVDPKVDYQKVRYHDGVNLYYAKNPINDLFSLTISVDVGTNQNNKVAIAGQFLDKSGTSRYSAEDLKKEWYKLGTEFSFGAGNDETSITISGLDENFGPSLALMMDLLNNPKADKATLDELIKIILVKREDAKKDPRTITGAVVLYNRYGKDSRYLRMIPNEAVKKLTVDELHGVIHDLLNYKHTISYTGSLPLKKLQAALKTHHPISGKLKDPPPYLFLKARAPEADAIRVFNKEMAQTRVDIEFGDEAYNEANIPAIEFYNDYFAGGMSGIVFQELREARALAYGVHAEYVTRDRKGEQSLVWGVILCQPDKAVNAVNAFIDLFDNLPESPERFEETRKSIVNKYRTSKTGFRAVLGAVRSWERLSIPVDPRKSRCEKIRTSDMDLMRSFHKAHVKDRVKLISVVGDTTRIDMAGLAKIGKPTTVGLEDIFVF